MATQETNNDAKKVGGYLKEKITIGMSRVSDDELVRALAKVTSHKLKPPNEKHLERLVNATHGVIETGRNEYEDVDHYIMEQLEAHTHTRNWVVVLKTLIVYNTLMNKGGDRMLSKIATRRQMFNTSHMKDLADSPDGALQEGFVHAYARYLEERCVAITSCRFQTRIEKEAFTDHFMEIHPASAAPIAAALLLQFEVLLQVDLREAALNNHATLQAFMLVIDDGRRLYAVLTKRVVKMLDDFFGYDAEQKQAWIGLFKRYQAATKQLAALFERMNASPVEFGQKFPSLTLMPDSLLSRLESVALDSEVSADTAGGPGAGGAPRSKSPELFKRKATGSAPAPSPFAVPGVASPAAAAATAAEAPAATAHPVPTTAARSGGSPPAASEPPAKKADPLGDLFGSTATQPAPSAAAPAGTAAAPQVAQPGATTTSTTSAATAPDPFDNLFAAGAAPVQTASPATAAPPAATAPAAPAQPVDPFAAPAATQQWGTAAAPAPQAASNPPPPPAASTGTAVDFFATQSQPQQQQAQARPQDRPPQQQPAPGGGAAMDQLDFFASSSQPAAGQKPRAW